MSGSILEFPFFLCYSGTCDNGGTWIQGHCLCLSGFSGDHCELQEIRCQSGSQWDGLKCHCHSTFYGSQCEFAVEQVALSELLESCPMHFLLEGAPDSPWAQPCGWPGAINTFIPALSPKTCPIPSHVSSLSSPPIGG